MGERQMWASGKYHVYYVSSHTYSGTSLRAVNRGPMQHMFQIIANSWSMFVFFFVI